MEKQTGKCPGEKVMVKFFSKNLNKINQKIGLKKQTKNTG